MPTTVTMPQLGETVVEGTILKWLKNEGDTIELDEPLFEISTDKVDTEVPSPASGTLTQILVQEGETVDVGTKLAQIGGAGSGDGAAPSSPPAQEAPPEPATQQAADAAMAAASEGVGDVAPGQGPAHVLLDRPGAVGECGECLPMSEETDERAVLDHEERIGSRGGQALEGVGRTHVRRTGRTDGLQDSAERRHQAAAMAIATSRAVNAPSGMPADVVTRITCRPLSRSTRTASPSGNSGLTSGKGVRAMSAARPSS